MLLEQLQKRFGEIVKRLGEIRAMKAEDLTDAIRQERDGLLTEAETVKSDIEAEEKASEFDKLKQASRSNPNGGDPDGRSGSIEIEDQPIYRGPFALGFQIRDIIRASSPNISGTVRTEAVSRLERAGRRSIALMEKNDPEFREMRAAGTGQTEGVMSEGGFLLQAEQSVELVTRGFNNSEVLKRCSKRTLTTGSKVNIIGIDEKSRANGSRHGGIRVYTTAELDQMTESRAKFSKVTIEPHKLTGLWYASDEILEDVVFLSQEMTDLFGKEFAFKTQDLVINGTGAGEALGITNAACTVQQAKESGQAGSTVVFENISKMWSRTLPGSRANLIWLINNEVEPQLDSMYLAVGTGGVPVYLPAGGLSDSPYGRLKGRPVIPIEQCQALGTAGDIMVGDFSEYIVADKGGINSASSIHLKFDYNQTVFRFIYRFDGRPRYSSALSPYKGSATISPFVKLATRS